MTRIARNLTTLVLALAAASALVVVAPARALSPSPLLTYSGYLRDATGKVVTTATTLTFRFYATAEGGTAVWEDAVDVLPNADGYFSAILGASGTNPLLPTDFLAQLWLGLQVSTDAAEMTPRTRLTSVPYALAVDWEGVTGRPATFPADMAVVQARVTGTCPANQFMQSVDGAGAVACGVPIGGGDVTDVFAGSGIAVSNSAGPQPTVSLASCANGQILKSDGTNWGCSTDANSGGDLTDVFAGNGISVTGGTGPQPTVAIAPCANGQVLKHNGTSWVCAADAVTDPTSYIQNQAAANQSASFRIGGSGALGGDLTVTGDGLFGMTLAAGYTTPQRERLRVRIPSSYVGAGTVGGFASGTTVTGAGTAFLTSAKAGDILWVGATRYRITTVASDTSLTVEETIATDFTGQTYSIQAPAVRVESLSGTEFLSVDARGAARFGGGSGITRMQHGTIGTCDGTLPTSSVGTETFDVAFAKAPRVFLQPFGAASSCTSARVTAVSSTAFNYAGYSGATGTQCDCIYWFAFTD